MSISLKSIKKIKGSNPNSDTYGAKKSSKSTRNQNLSLKDIDFSNYDLGVDENYIKSYATDYNEYFKNIQSDYEGMTYENSNDMFTKYSDMGSSLRDRGTTIKAFLNSRRSNIPDEQYNSLVSAIDEFGKTYEQQISSFRAKNDYYSRFETKDAYNAHLDYEKKKNEDADALKKEIKELEGEITNYTTQARNEQIKADMAKIAETYGLEMKQASPNDSISDAAALISNREELKNIANMFEVYEFDPLQKKANTIKFNALGVNNPFGDKAIPIQHAPLAKKTNSNESGVKLSFGGAEIEVDGGRINNNSTTIDTLKAQLDAKRQYLAEVEEIQEYEGYISEATSAEDRYEYIQLAKNDEDNRVAYVQNNPKEVEEKAAHVEGNAQAKGYYDDFYKYTLMTDREVTTYNYLWGKYGEDKANEFLKIIEDDLEERYQSGIIENVSDFADEMPVLSSAYSVATSLASGLEWLGDTGKFLFTGEMDENFNAAQTQAIRGTVSENYDVNIGDWDAFDFVYNTGMSAIDSYVGGKIGGSVAKGLGSTSTKVASRVAGGTLGLSAAASATNDGLARGMSDGQALSGGIAAGVFEMIFESWSIGSFMDETAHLKNLGGKNYIKNATQYMGKNLWNNAKEEGLTEIANITYDFLANGGYSDAALRIKELMSEGMSESDAKLQTAKELGLQVVEASASGALMSVPFSARDIRRIHKRNKAMGKAYGNDVSALVEKGLASGEGTESHQLAVELKKKLDSGATLSNAEITNLVDANQEAKNDEIKTDAEQRLAKYGVKGNTSQIAEIIAKKSMGAKLTSAEINTLQNSEFGNRVYNEITNDELVEYTQNMSESDANLFLSQYDAETNGKIENYSTSFNLVETLAKNDYSQEYILEHKGVLSESQVNAIYAAKVMSGEVALTKELKDLKSKHINSPFIAGQVDTSVIDFNNSVTGAVKTPNGNKTNWSELDAYQQTAIVGISKFAKGLGMDVVWVSDGIQRGMNGAFEVDGNRMLIDIHAGKDKIGNANMRDTIIPTASHEMVHWARNKSPEIYRKLDKFVFDSLALQGISEKDAIDKRRRLMEKAHPGVKYTDAEVREEVVARASEELLQHSEKFKECLESMSEKEKKTLVGKIKEILTNIKNWINKFLAGQKSKSPEAEALRKDMKRLLEQVKIFEKMLEDAALTNQALQHEGITEKDLSKRAEKNTTDEGDVKFSDRTFAEQVDAVLNGEDTISTHLRISEHTPQILLDLGLSDKPLLITSAHTKTAVGTKVRKKNTHYISKGVFKKLPELIEKPAIIMESTQKGSIVMFVNAVDVNNNPIVCAIKISGSGFYNGVELESNVVTSVYGKDTNPIGFIEKAVDENRLLYWDKKMSQALFDIPGLRLPDNIKNLDSNVIIRKINANVKENTVKNSDRDSLGNTLTKAQQTYFADSKVRDENGNLKVMYHGSPKTDISSFRLNLGGAYFTSDSEYAKAYARGTGKVYEVYLNITKPFDTRNAKDRAIFEKEFYGKWGNGAPLSEKGLPDWTDGDDLIDFLQEKGYDYDGLILDEGGVPTESGVKDRGISYVVFDKANQVKYTDNLNPTFNEDMKFSLRENVEETKDLVAVHNLSEEKLLKSLQLGGLPMPSIAIARAKEGHSSFGKISLVFSKDTIDPQSDRNNKVYSGDAWTPTYPQIDYKLSKDVAYKAQDKISELLAGTDYENAFGYLGLDTENMQSSLNRNGGNIVDAYGDKPAIKLAYLKDNGIELELPKKQKDLSSRFDNEVVIKIAEKYGEEKTREINNADTTTAIEKYIPEIKEIVEDYYSDLTGTKMDWQIGLHDVYDIVDASLNYFRKGIQSKTDTSSATRQMIDEAIDDTAYKKWLDELFAGIVEKEGIRNNKDMFTPSGNRRSFEALHYEHNLENVIKAMKGNGDKGLGVFGRGNIFGAATTEYKSIDDIKGAAKTRLQNIPQEEYEAMREGFAERFFELANSLPIHKGSFTATDDAADMLIESISKYKTKSGIANYLRTESKGWANYSDYVVDDLIQLVSEIRQMPAGYFEAKPQRAVGFDEVATAIIPDSASAELKTMLTDKGVKFVEYESGNEDARLKALNSLEEVKFSDRDSEGNTLTKEQKEFFKESKVRDENGNLRVMWHGTSAKFTVFDISKAGNNWGGDSRLGKGFYFANTKEEAFEWSKSTNVIKAYLNLVNPLDLTAPTPKNIAEEIDKYVEKLYAKYDENTYFITREQYKENLKRIREMYLNDASLFIDTFKYDDKGNMTDGIREFLSGLGYDGIISKDEVVAFYPEQIKNTTNKKPTSNPDIRYSDRDNVSVYDRMGETERLIKENEQLQEDVERLKERLKLERQVTHGEYFNQNQLDAVAGHIRNLANSNFDKKNLATLIDGIYKYISHSPDLNWQDMFAQCYDVARMVLDEANPITETNDYYKMVLKSIRGTRISANEKQIQNAKYRFGNRWHNAFFGKVTITDNATSLDRQWQEWSSAYPDLFDADISDADMLVELYDIYDSLREGSETVVEYDMEEQTRWLAYEIYNKFWTVQPVRTTADRYDKKIKHLKFEHRKAMDKLREQRDAKLKAQHNRDKQKAMELYKNLRERKDKEIAEVKKLGKERMDAYKENAERKTQIQSITANALTLNKWLTKNSKEHHIHEAMKGPVIKLLQALDFSSEWMLKNNAPTQKDITLAKAFASVKEMLIKAESGAEGLIELYGHDLGEGIETLVKAADRLVGDNNYVINKMTLEELKQLDKLVKYIKKVVSDLNKFHTVNHAKGIASLSQEQIEYADSLGKTKEYDTKTLKGITAKLVNWDNKVPYYAFKQFGTAGQKIFEAFQDGWDKLSFNAKKIIDFTKKAYTDQEVKEWSKEIKTFDICLPVTNMDLANPDYKPKYKKVQITVPQIMSLYCSMKREQAKGHILAGGIRVADIKGKNGQLIKDAEGITLTVGDILHIIGTLTPRQRQVADALQKFMNNECADWGNEVSMRRFGYKAFGEENYFPIESDANNHSGNDAPQENGNSLFKLLNMSFTKNTVEGANNRIVIKDIFDVFAAHSSDMAKYNALALPVLDANRWFNYTEKIETEDDRFITKSVKTSIEDAFGKEGKEYIRTFLKDINGQKNVGRDTLGKGFFSNAKIASVAFNIRVALLQPTSYFKASAVMKDKYLSKALLHKPKYKHAEKYCGMALWKSLGYYDTDISRGLTEKIKHEETWKDKAIKKAMIGAEWGDKITLGYLWNACELEIRETRKELKVGSDEFFDAVGKRLREVIYATQVVDSTMTRSQIMRSGNMYEKMLTAFSSEPTLAFNMLQDAYVETKSDAKRLGKKEALKKNGKKIVNVVAAYTVTNIVAALIESGFDAFRDDDDEEMDVAEFMKLYFKNFATDMSISGKIPYIKELVSLAQGFSSSRTDTQWMQSAANAINGTYKNIVEDKGNPVTTLKNWIKTFSYFSGLPFYNVYRDTMAALNKFDILTAEELEEMLDDLFG